MKNKKAQIAGQVFIYILAIFVFAVILLYGYTAIKGFIGKGEETAFIQFKNTLEGEVSRISTEPGDIIVFDERNPLPIPGTYEKICFVDSNAEIEDTFNLDSKEQQIISAAINAGVHNRTENVFLIPPAQSPIFLGILETWPNNILCVNNENGLVRIRIEGKGYGVRISALQ